MARDEILDKVHENRVAVATRYGDDLNQIYKAFLKKQEENMKAGEEYASFPPKIPKKVA